VGFTDIFAVLYQTKKTMSPNFILQYFIPKDPKFYFLFEEASSNLVAISKVLCQVMAAPTPEKRIPFIREVEKLEHVGDEITHRIFQQVSHTFITPFDREDIQRLASVLDDVLDHIHGAAKRIELYKVDTIHPSMAKLAELILQSSEQVNIAVLGLRNKRSYVNVREALVKINSLENHADDIFDSAVARLFEDNVPAIEVIKIKEVLSALETATDKCEDAANVIESVIVKFA
jgi:predicted phosphate transport protein (TIGR00153 family)